MSEPYLGQIQAFGFSFAPRGWAQCQGQILSIAQNTALFALLGTTYGGNGQTTFALPDLRGRAGIGVGQGPGLSDISLGEISGTENVTLLVTNMPIHTHSATATSSLQAEGIPGTANNPQGKMLAGISNGYIPPDPSQNKVLASDAVATTVTVGATGGSQPFAKRDPYLGLNFCIALEGIFPPRN